MHIVFIGPPGVGKGTQANMLIEKYPIVKISTGDLLRDSIKNSSPLGKKAKEYMEKGELVPDELVLGLVQEKISNPEGKGKTFIFDGFPRNLQQAKELDLLLTPLQTKINLVIDFTMDEEERILRLTGRRMCPRCQRTYHVVYAKPKSDNLCDICHVALVQRTDDNESVIRQRSIVYWEHTKPLLHYYENRKILENVDASKPIEIVFSQIENMFLANMKTV